MYIRIEHRKPSCCTLGVAASPLGSALIGFPREQGDEFLPATEILNFYGSLESWLAHVLLKRCAGCPREVRR